MLGALRDFERALCVAHSSAEMATFDHGKHQPHPVHHGRNYDQVTELIGGKFQALLEQPDRLPIFPQGVITLCETVEQFSQQDAVVALPREASSCLTKLDGTTLLANEEMVIASECGISCAAQLVPEARENGIKLIQTAPNPLSLTLRQQSVTKPEAKIHGLSDVVGSFRQFLQNCQRALEKARSVRVCVKRVSLVA